jgi:hypothetical protein
MGGQARRAAVGGTNLYGVGAGLLGGLGDALGWPVFVITMILTVPPPSPPSFFSSCPPRSSARPASSLAPPARSHGRWGLQGNVSGLASGEWVGTSSGARAWMAAGLLLLLAAVRSPATPGHWRWGRSRPRSL